MIDAAMPFSLKGIMDTEAKLNKKLTRMILTHAHDDHIGALDGLKSNVQRLRCTSLSEIRHYYVEIVREGEPQTPIKGGVPKKIATKPDVLLHEGDTIGSLTAIHTPGHTPGSMSFLDSRSGAVIVGDALQTFRGTAVAGTIIPLFPFPAMATWNKAQALNSAIKLLELSPALLAVGHGNLLKAPKQEMEKAIRKAQMIQDRSN